jgi:hypothetical protein
VDEVMQGHDRFQAVLLAGREDVRVMIQCRGVERRRRSFRVLPRRLHAAPFDAEPEGVEPEFAAAREVFGVAIPEIRRAPERRDVALPLCARPVRLRFARAIVAAFGLIGGSGDAPEEVFEVHGYDARWRWGARSSLSLVSAFHRNELPTAHMLKKSSPSL